MELFRFIGVTLIAYITVCTGCWLYLCLQYQQILLDVTLRQFLFGWWQWLN